MKNRTTTWFTMLMLGIFATSFTIVGCGGEEAAKDDAAKAEGEMDKAEENADASSGGDFASLNQEMADIIMGINSVEDVEAADGKIGSLMDKMAGVMKDFAGDPSKLMEMQNDPKVQEVTQKLSAHVAKITQDNPEIGAKIAQLMAKHSGKLQEAASEMVKNMDADDMKEMQEKAEEVMDDAKEAMEDAKK